MPTNHPEGRPIRDYTFEEFCSLQNVRGYVYPKRNVSAYVSLLSKAEQAALNVWGWIAVLCGLAGIVLPFVMGHWAWALLVVLGIGIWRSNRRSMEQFFLERLKKDEAFFNAVAAREDVRVVLGS
jgi:hypothetical protein